MNSCRHEGGRFAAVDIGGSLSRVMVARTFPNGKVAESCNRFVTPLQLSGDEIHTNVTSIAAKILNSLREVSDEPLVKRRF